MNSCKIALVENGKITEWGKVMVELLVQSDLRNPKKQINPEWRHIKVLPPHSFLYRSDDSPTQLFLNSNPENLTIEENNESPEQELPNMNDVQTDIGDDLAE